jgi:hypothetical protein
MFAKTTIEAQPLKTIIAAIDRARGDDFERAQHASGRMNDTELDKQYGQSGQTCRQVLQGYKDHADACAEAKTLINDIASGRVRAVHASQKELLGKVSTWLGYAKGDNLERCEHSFKSCSPAAMKDFYGQSGHTRQEILDGYKAERAVWQQARDAFDKVVPSLK